MHEENRADALLKKIVSDIEDRILSGDLMPGDKVPTESEISQRYMVSRNIVRRALRRLELNGMVDAAQGRGRFVRRPPVRLSLPRYDTVPIETPDDMGVYRSQTRQITLATPPSHITHALSVSDKAKMILAERLFYLDQVPVGLSRQYISGDRFPNFIEAFERCNGSVSHALASVGVRQFERAFARLSTRLPTPEECELIHMPAHVPLLVTNSLLIDELGPFQYAESRFSSDRVEIDLLPKREQDQPTTHPAAAGPVTD